MYFRQEKSDQDHMNDALRRAFRDAPPEDDRFDALLDRLRASGAAVAPRSGANRGETGTA